MHNKSHPNPRRKLEPEIVIKIREMKTMRYKNGKRMSCAGIARFFHPYGVTIWDVYQINKYYKDIK